MIDLIWPRIQQYILVIYKSHYLTQVHAVAKGGLIYNDI